ncbi:carboxypeptidase regulatory-like domain-containing protein [Acidobacteriota bacterium]
MLKNLSIKHILSTIISILLFCLALSPLYADDYGSLWGKVSNSEGIPVNQARIQIEGISHNSEATVKTDTSGHFRVSGLRSGHYRIQIQAPGHHPAIDSNLHLLPSETLYIKIRLAPENTQEQSLIDILYLDYTNNIQQTLIDQSQLQNTPTAHNVWAVVENQDLSATTNRIDIGGLWGNIPALFSARGSVSWTQTTYLLNGFDVTDPYSTGQPLFHPDFYALSYSQLYNGAHPPFAISPGGYFNLITQRGTPSFHGGFSTFYIHNSLQGSNITPQLQEEGLDAAHEFDYSMDGNIHLSGPLIDDKLTFFLSVSANDLSRKMADFEALDKSRLLSGLISLHYNLRGSEFQFLWTGQKVDYASYGADRKIPFDVTSDRSDRFNVLQAVWLTRIKDAHYLKAGLNYTDGNIKSRFQEGAEGPYGNTLFQEIPSGIAPMAFEDNRKTLAFQVRGESFLGEHLKARHKLLYGLQVQYAQAISQKNIAENLHLHFFEDKALEVIQYSTPIEHQESGLNLNFYLQDTLTLSNFLSLYVGVNFDYSRGWIPGQDTGISGEKSKVQWFTMSPRIGIIIPLSPSKKAALKLSFARYYFRLPLSYLTYGNGNALGGMAYEWTDKNGDMQFQENERGILLRREGPLYAQIDPELKRPYTNEFSIVYSVVFSPNWSFSLGGFYRGTRDQIKTVNIGVPFTEYRPEYILDLGDDNIPQTTDDQIFTVFDQNRDTLGNDFFLLSNHSADKRTTHYFGLDIILAKRFSSKFSFFFSLTATLAEGTTNPGNTEFENDDGIVGTLYDDPNTLINAKGRVRFDRAYTSRMGLTYTAPYEIKLGCIIKYYDGHPFARKLIVEDFNQGPFYIQTHTRGAVRYEFNLNLDIRLEKAFQLGNGKLRFILDGFNMLNSNLSTEENEWTGPEFKDRYATEIMSPRVFRLGVAYDF